MTDLSDRIRKEFDGLIALDCEREHGGGNFVIVATPEDILAASRRLLAAERIYKPRMWDFANKQADLNGPEKQAYVWGMLKMQKLLLGDTILDETEGGEND